jgi:DNA gyrase subunit A
MAKRKKTEDSGAGGERSAPIPIQDVPFHETARRRYLNYAMSVITSRALPDVRDGLKPVQRRILYTMQHELHLSPAAKPIKCGRIVGDVLGKFHPHGDAAIYEALVRMAQDFSLRYPLVDGHGNFGSLDGDAAAAYRYTEARLQSIATELLQELPRETVEFRPNYDGKTQEPVVLPARIPHLLLNGATGIAVGMATNIPPHNLEEVAAACEALIEERELTVADLLKHIKGPDFPTGGQILNPHAELRQIYEEGQGAVRVRAEYELEEHGRGPKVVITSIPYMVQKDVLVRSIGELVAARKVPQLLDVRDESTTDVRIVLELKKEADPDVVMAYLFRHTALQSNFNVNLTCLVPPAVIAGKPAGKLAGGATIGTTGGAAGEAAAPTPARIDLKSLLVHFIDFRYQVVERRFQHDLRLIRERIHILEGFRSIFDALDEAIRIVRRSDGRADAGEKLKQRFRLDDVQADAILELRLYKLARLEIEAILKELREKRKEAQGLEEILSSPRRLWAVVKREIAEVRAKYPDPRRSKVGGRGVQETEYDEEAFIVDEDAFILLSRDGWVRRAGRITDIDKVRLRQGDEVLAVVAGNTRSLVVFFSNFGSAYTTRINDIPASRGYGDPVQGLFKFRDGERVVGAVSLDPRMLTDIGSAADAEGTVPKNHLLVVGSGGYALRCSLAPFAEPSTRSGRRFARLKEGEEVAGVHVVDGSETVVLATRKGRVILFKCGEVSFLGGPGRGVLAIKLDKEDRVLGAAASRRPGGGLRVVTAGGRTIEVTPKSYKVTGRAGKGFEVIKRGGLERVEAPAIELPVLPEAAGAGDGAAAEGGAPRRNGGGRGKGAARETEDDASE